VGRALAVLGLLVGLAGFGGLVFEFSTASQESGPGSFGVWLAPGVPLVPVAFGAFLIGGLVYGLGLTMSKTARKRQEEQRRRGSGRRYRR
jgi:hypothetical protein